MGDANLVGDARCAAALAADCRRSHDSGDPSIATGVADLVPLLGVSVSSLPGRRARL